MSIFKRPISIREFAADRRANVAMIFALSALALVGLTGMGIDYYTALSAKAQLDLAADAASIETITTVRNYITANPGIDVATAYQNIQASAVSQGKSAFLVNAGKTFSRMMTTVPVPNLALGTDNQTITATVSYTAASPNAFGPIFRVNSINMSGTSSASLTMPKYLDFYMLLDMSGSMGFPSSAAGQTTLATYNPDDKSLYPTGCLFACHFSGSQGYAVAAQYNVQLRAAAIGVAVQDLIANAKLTMANTKITNQFRLGIYPFITTMDTFYALSTDLDSASSAISNLGNGNGQGLSNLLDTGSSSQGATCTKKKKQTTCTPGYGSGGTNINVALNGSGSSVPGIVSEIKVAGNGSSQSSPQPFVFLVTDGVQNGQTYDTPTGSGFTGSTPANIDPSWCTAVKQNAYLAILYIPYQTIDPANHGFAGDEDGKVNTAIPSIPSTLQSCASSGFYFTANTPTDINNTMVQMFYQAVAQSAHLTH